MNLSDKQRRAIFSFFVILILVALAGLFVHELGHGLTASALGGKFIDLYTFPGIQIWPNFGQAYPHLWPGYVGLAEYSYGSSWSPEGWQSGLVMLMGSGANLLLAALALAALWGLRPRGGLRLLLAAETFMFIDLPLYTFLPLVGLRHFFFIGGASPEPLDGALQLGFPAWLFMVLVGVVSILLGWGLIRYLRRYPFWEA